MEINKKLILLFMLMLLMSSFTYAQQEMEPIPSSVVLPAGQFLTKPPSTQSLSFVSVDSVDAVSDLKRTKIAIVQTASNGKLDSNGQRATAGEVCNIGEYVIVRNVASGIFSSGSLVFGQVWLKSSSNDIIYLDQYYTKDLEGFTYIYECYEGAGGTELTYTCFDGEWRGEPGTPYASRSGTCPTNKCLINSIDEDVVSPQNILCKINPQDPEPDKEIVDINIKNVVVLGAGMKPLAPGEKFEKGDFVNVVAEYEILNADCDDCVIETTLSKLPGTTSAIPLSIVNLDSQKGACGDELTTGVKFDAKKGDKGIVTLTLNAWESGRWSVPVVAYNGCYANLGEDLRVLDKESVIVNVADDGGVPGSPRQPNTIKFNSPSVKPGGCSGLPDSICKLDIGDSLESYVDVVSDSPFILVLVYFGAVIFIIFGVLFMVKPKKAKKRGRRR